MRISHTRTFRVRLYECDARGNVHNANYLRYMQEAAFDASAAAGYDGARFAALGRSWLIRDTDITYYTPLHYDDSVDVTTWVLDFQRVRSRRAYEFRRHGSGELAARAVTDWVFTDTATGLPASIPPEVAAAYLPPQPEPIAPRQRFPQAPPAPPGAYITRRRVQWSDLDPVQHVNNAVYIAYLEDCAEQAARACGWPGARMRAAGFEAYVRRHRIEYRQPGLLDDELDIATWLSDVRRASAVRHSTITRASDGASLARAQTLLVWADPTACRPARAPQAFLDDLRPNTAVTGIPRG